MDLTVTAADPERLQQRVQELETERRHLVAVIELLDAITGSFDVDQICQTVVHKLAEMYGLDRCSLFTAEHGHRTVRLMATYEDPTLANHLVDLERYPEIRQALMTNQPVVIDDIGTHAFVADVRDSLEQRGIRQIRVVPISWKGSAVGALFLRTLADGPTLSEADERFLGVVASLAAKALRTAWRVHQLQQGGGDANVQQATLLAFLRRLLNDTVPAGTAIGTADAERLTAAMRRVLEREGQVGG